MPAMSQGLSTIATDHQKGPPPDNMSLLEMATHGMRMLDQRHPSALKEALNLYEIPIAASDELSKRSTSVTVPFPTVDQVLRGRTSLSSTTSYGTYVCRSQHLTATPATPLASAASPSPSSASGDYGRSSSEFSDADDEDRETPCLPNFMTKPRMLPLVQVYPEVHEEIPTPDWFELSDILNALQADGYSLKQADGYSPKPSQEPPPPAPMTRTETVAPPAHSCDVSPPPGVILVDIESSPLYDTLMEIESLAHRIGTHTDPAPTPSVGPLEADVKAEPIDPPPDTPKFAYCSVHRKRRRIDYLHQDGKQYRCLPGSQCRLAPACADSDLAQAPWNRAVAAAPPSKSTRPRPGKRRRAWPRVRSTKCPKTTAPR